MKRLLPFLSCFLSFAYAQVERVDTQYTLRVQPHANTDENAADENTERPPITAREHKQAAFILQKRLRALRLSKSEVTPQDEDLIHVSIPGLSPEEAESVKHALTTPAQLGLKRVHPDNRQLADKVADKEAPLPAGYELKVLHDLDQDGRPTTENLLVRKKADITGSDIKEAQELYGPYEGQLDVTLNEDGAQEMRQVTQAMQLGHDRLAILLDDEVLSAPVVQAVLGEKFQITGMGSVEEAQKFALALKNPLKYPLILIEEKRPPTHILQDPGKQAAP
ncbi:hypothetical protein HW115_02135 [Verrucomicrobiaceae bacterium N1E253]|uniref:SecDF P1 head subdomain domain-containing protein n=1 Tax=Oceaniferula marina TaxID=2748318 RepID=A0A851G9W3_9BACT|nr:hypothetical protein [Oceaniferula marina]NWK54393.1 hypothetical protein [Oceaniferula marina]